MPDEFVVYTQGLFFASVCSSLGGAATDERMAIELCGTHTGWTRADEDFADGTPNPTPCDTNPETHKHYLYAA